ncbi:MAG: hypothetical protein QME25_03910 [Bacteroidota bacterium]|nr:hypothetical protein [Bacteroidota bacterium]
MDCRKYFYAGSPGRFGVIRVAKDLSVYPDKIGVYTNTVGKTDSSTNITSLRDYKQSASGGLFVSFLRNIS